MHSRHGSVRDLSYSSEKALCVSISNLEKEGSRFGDKENWQYLHDSKLCDSYA